MTNQIKHPLSFIITFLFLLLSYFTWIWQLIFKNLKDNYCKQTFLVPWFFMANNSHWSGRKRFPSFSVILVLFVILCHISIYLSIYLRVSISIRFIVFSLMFYLLYLTIYQLSIYLVYLAKCSICQSIYLAYFHLVYLTQCSIYHIYIYINISSYPSIYKSFNLSIYLSIYISIYLSIRFIVFS